MNSSEFKVNQKIYSILYGGRYGYIKEIKGKQTPETVTTFMDGVGVMGGSATLIIRFNNGTETSIPESIARGVQWKAYEVMTSEEIAEYDKEYFEAIEERNKKAEEKKRVDEATKIQLLEKYSSYLIQPKDHKKGGFDCVKQNIRIELKKEFPGIKFSVSSSHYGTVEVRWTDGPTREDVCNITGKYEDHENDFTGDFRDYNPSVFNDLFGGTKYVFETRDMSEQTEKILNEWAEERFLNNDMFNCHNTGNLAYKLFSHCPVYQNPKVEKIVGITCGLNSPETFYKVVSEKPEVKVYEKKETTNNVVCEVNKDNLNLKLVDYSEKCIVVTGDTYQIKDTLKGLNGKFNKFLSCGAGWIFPKTQTEVLKETLGISL